MNFKGYAAINNAKKGALSLYNFKEMNDVTSENLVDFATPRNKYNLSIEGGKLVSGIGLERATFTNDLGGYTFLPDFEFGILRQAFVYYKTNEQGKEENMIIAKNSSGDFYRLDLKANAKWTLIDNMYSSSDVNAINYRYENKDVILICSKSAVLQMYDGESMTAITAAPKINSMCEHYGRIFASTFDKPNAVWFSDDYNPLNWKISLEEAGKITFADSLGSVVKVVSFNDYVYIFRKHAIFRLTAFSKQTDFELVKIAEISGNIYENTIAICEEKIVFLTSEGLYLFDGYNLNKIVKNVTKLKNVSEPYVASGYASGKYYLAFRHVEKEKIHQETGLFTNNYVLIYDVENNRAQFSKGMDIYSMSGIKMNNTSNCLVVLRGENNKIISNFTNKGKYHNEELKYSYSTIKYYFNAIDKKKYISDIDILTKYDVNIELELDDKKYVYSVKGSNDFTKVKIMKSCKGLRLSIKGEGLVDVGGIKINYSMVR